MSEKFRLLGFFFIWLLCLCRPLSMPSLFWLLSSIWDLVMLKMVDGSLLIWKFLFFFEDCRPELIGFSCSLPLLKVLRYVEENRIFLSNWYISFYSRSSCRFFDCSFYSSNFARQLLQINGLRSVRFSILLQVWHFTSISVGGFSLLSSSSFLRAFASAWYLYECIELRRLDFDPMLFLPFLFSESYFLLFFNPCRGPADWFLTSWRLSYSLNSSIGSIVFSSDSSISWGLSFVSF